MIAPLPSVCVDHLTQLPHERFAVLVPKIRRQAAWALRRLRREAREEFIQEVIANAFVAWSRLVAQGREHIARPTPLADFALRQVRAGRRVGCRLNSQDVMSPAARRQSLRIAQLDQLEKGTESWRQLLIEDRHAGPAETAAARMDLAAWWITLSERNRRIARALAGGESTRVVARQFGLSPGRISQLRGWLRRHWEQFQGDRHSAHCQPNTKDRFTT